MTKIKHIPGPYYLDGPKQSDVANGQVYYTIATKHSQQRRLSNERTTYVMPGFFYPHSVQTSEEMQATAEVLAAAPEMAEALIEILKTGFYHTGAGNKAIAAIEKAGLRYLLEEVK